MRRLLILMLALAPLAGQAAGTVGQLFQSGSSTEVNRLGRVVQAQSGSGVEIGDQFNTALGEAAALRMADEEVISLAASSSFQVLSYQFDPSGGAGSHARYRLDSGSARLISGLIAKRQPGAVVLETPHGEFSTQGTDYLAGLCGADCDGPPGVYVAINSGAVTARSSGGSLTASAGQIVFVAAGGGAPVLVPAMPKKVAVAPNPAELMLAIAIPGGGTLRLEVTTGVCDVPSSPTLPECTDAR